MYLYTHETGSDAFINGNHFDFIQIANSRECMLHCNATANAEISGNHFDCIEMQPLRSDILNKGIILTGAGTGNNKFDYIMGWDWSNDLHDVALEIGNGCAKNFITGSIYNYTDSGTDNQLNIVWGKSLQYEVPGYVHNGKTDSVTLNPDGAVVNISSVICLEPIVSPPNPAYEGMIYADTDHHLYYYNSTDWVRIV